MRKTTVISILFMMLCLCGCNRNRYVSFSGYAQGGLYTVKANLKGVTMKRQDIAQDIDSILTRISFSLSGYNKNSLISKYNEGEKIETNDLFDEIFTLSIKYMEESGNAFDIYSAPLFDIWGFGFTDESMPSEESIQLALEESQSKKKINFNAIAQGYTCDVVARYLHSIGVKDMLVDIGEIYCEGLNASGRGWSIGIDNPTDGNMTPGADLRGVWNSQGNACGIVTSGNYRKFYVKDGKKYSHTIDPRTGHPVTHDLLSATIVAPTAAEADAFATACMVLGFEESKALILNHGEMEGYLITADTTWTSPGFGLQEQ